MSRNISDNLAGDDEAGCYFFLLVILIFIAFLTIIFGGVNG